MARVRQDLTRRHAEFRRRCDEEGMGYLEQPPLPLTAPSWFKTDTGEREVIEGQDTSPDPNRIDLPEGVDSLGRSIAAPRQPTVEEIFAQNAKRSLGDRVRDAVRRQT